MKKNEKILKDHKQIGKKLVPPLMHSIPLQLSSYTEELLPEIIWMGLINEELGYRKGTDLIRKFIKSAYDSKTSDDYVNFSISSNLYKLDINEKKVLIQKLLNEDIYLEVSDILSPLIYFYNDSPFSFLNKEVDLTEEEEQVLLEKLKKSLHNNFDRFKQASNVAQLNVYYTRILDGKVHFHNGMKIPDFNSIINNPNSEEANEASAFVRNGVKSEFMHMSDVQNHDYSWSKSFWNQSYKLDNCE